MLARTLRLSLAKQGLLLVLILISLELLFVGALVWQIQQAEMESRREEELKAIAVKIQHVGRAIFECRKALRYFVAARSEHYWQEYDKQATDLKNTLADLQADLKPYPEQSEVMERIDQEFKYCVGWMADQKEKFMQMDPMEAARIMNDPKQTVVQTYGGLVEDLMSLGRSMEKRLADSPEQQRKLRKVILYLLGFGLAVNVCFAALVQLLFTRGITSRLAVMVDNTNRLKRGQELNQKLGGADEITMLDQSFHCMSEELAEAQRAKQAFVAMISHDLRTPLTTVQGFLYLLTTGALGTVPEVVVQKAGKVDGNVERLIRLINDLLDLEKLEAGKMELAIQNVVVDEAVERSLEAVKGVADANGVNIKYSESDLAVDADPDRLEQVLVNLLSNACKFSPPGGAVKVDVVADERELEFRITDEGRGIPKHAQDLIFERYRQVQVEDGSKKGGTGLGLPICKLIVEQHGGSIGVVSEEGKGACFWIKLPLRGSGAGARGSSPS